MRTSSFGVATAQAMMPATAKPAAAKDHLIANFIGDINGPTLIVVGSLHGNERAGSEALHSVARDLKAIEQKLKGRVYFLRGNVRALEQGTRFIDTDLNRSWSPDRMSGRRSELIFPLSEDIELRELDDILDHILITARDEVYVVDLHSTSADGMPFATVGDTLRNRNFAKQFPITILLGIEEQLEGTLLEYLNNLGAITLGFEGGQHRSQSTVRNHEAIVWLALANSGLLAHDDASQIRRAYAHLGNVGSEQMLFEVLHRHAVGVSDGFAMRAGFNNFDTVQRGDVIARDKNGPVRAEVSGLLLMPLYQRLGEDGYFIGRRVAGFWLWVSAVLRRMGVQNLVHLLPGVRMDENSPATLIVDTRIARLFPLQIFHLLGFRKLRWNRDKLVVSRRKHDTVSPFAKGA